jgi:prolycopene isomerase
VITEKGDEIAARCVVSNAATTTTYVDLMDPGQVPEKYMRELGTRTVGPSFVTVFMGFDCEPGELGIQQTTNFILADTDAERAYRLSKTLDAPEYMLMTCYDVDDPEFSPRGACQVSLVALAYAEAWNAIPPRHYFETKMAYAAKMLDLASRVFPELRGHIEEIDVGTPLTHMRYLGHPGGAAYGFDQHAKDTSLFTSRKSPIEGLFHAGAWSGSGGGFQPTLMSGDQAARKIVRTLTR